MRQLADAHVAPIADELDRTDEFPHAVHEVMVDAGLVQLAVPEEFGGAGGDVTSICVAREEVARAGSMALATLAAQNNNVALPLLGLATREQQERFLPELATGCITSFSLTEPHAGSDLGALRCRAVRDGGDWVIDGEKSFLGWGELARWCLVFARTGDEPGVRGISAFMVDTSDPGYQVTRYNHKMGQRGIPNVDILLDRVRVPDLHLIGGEGRGLDVALRGLHHGRPVLAAIALGGAEAALDYATDYLRNRQVKDGPASRFQGLRWKVADCATELEASRLMLYDVARSLDAGDHGPDLGTRASMAKYFVTETAVRVAETAIQLLGGAGYMLDHPVERYLRDVRVTTIYEGTSEVLRNTIARSLLGSSRPS